MCVWEGNTGNFPELFGLVRRAFSQWCVCVCGGASVRKVGRCGERWAGVSEWGDSVGGKTWNFPALFGMVRDCARSDPSRVD